MSDKWLNRLAWTFMALCPVAWLCLLSMWITGEWE